MNTESITTSNDWIKDPCLPFLLDKIEIRRIINFPFICCELLLPSEKFVTITVFYKQQRNYCKLTSRLAPLIQMYRNVYRPFVHRPTCFDLLRRNHTDILRKFIVTLGHFKIEMDKSLHLEPMYENSLASTFVVNTVHTSSTHPFAGQHLHTGVWQAFPKPHKKYRSTCIRLYI